MTFARNIRSFRAFCVSRVAQVLDNRLPIFVSLFALLWGLTSVAQAPDVLADLAKEWTRTREVVLSQNVLPPQKSEQISRFFEAVDRACQLKCIDTVEWLTQKNAMIGPNSRAYLLSQIKEALPSEVADPVSEELKKFEPSLDHAAEIARKFEAYVKSHPVDIKHRISASLEAIRFLVSTEEKAVFEILSKDPVLTQVGREALQKDLKMFTKQGVAIANIYSIFREMSKTQKVDPVQMQKVVARISELGIFYIKLAQTASNLTFMLPASIADPMRVFQDKIEPMSPELVLEIMTAELGRDPRQVFVGFDPAKPLASGSIAVTYEAKIYQGSRLIDVIIKVQRPGLREELKFNRKFNHFALKSMFAFATERFAPLIQFFSDQVMGLENAFEGELNFVNEAHALAKFRRLFFFDRSILIPKVFRRYTTRNIITMEKIEGVNLSKSIESGNPIDRYIEPDEKLIKAIDTNPTDEQKRRQYAVEKLFSLLWESTLYMVVLGELHADMHPGNILTNKLEEIEREIERIKLGIVDFGQTVKTKGLVWDPIKAGYFLLTGNSEAMAIQLLRMSDSTNASVASLKKIIDEVLLKHSIPRRNFRELIKAKNDPKNFDGLGEALNEIITRSYKEAGYVASSKYVQVLRSLAPVTGSMFLLAKEIPIKQLSKLVIFSSFRKVPLYFAGYVYNGVVETSSNAAASVRRRVRSWLFAPQCSALIGM